MPEATLLYEGRTLRIQVTDFRFEHSFDGGRRLGRAADTVELTGTVLVESFDFVPAGRAQVSSSVREAVEAVNELQSMVGELSRDTAKRAVDAEAGRERIRKRRERRAPKPKSAWDRLLADDLLEGAR